MKPAKFKERIVCQDGSVGWRDTRGMPHVGEPPPELTDTEDDHHKNELLPASHPLTDLGNAERMIDHYGDSLHFCYERNQWVVWNGKIWAWDTGARIAVLAEATVRHIYEEAAASNDSQRRKEIADHARRSESDQKCKGMIHLAQHQKGIPITLHELDANPYLFNCENGTLDLKTGTLYEHCKADLQTIMVPIHFDPSAVCPLWLRFLDRVTDNNAELIAYLQRAVGYSLTGDTKAQVLFFLWGLGSNGKTTFVVIVRKMLGDYGERINTDLLMLKDKNAGGPKKGWRICVANALSWQASWKRGAGWQWDLLRI